MSTETRQGVVDRFEDGQAVIYLLNQDEPIHIARKQLSGRIKAGDYVQIVYEDEQIISVTRDAAATRQARERIRAKVERLRRGEHLHPPAPETPPAED